MRSRPWDDWAERIVIHTPIYLDFDGSPSAGGRERHTRDFATLIRDRWRRPVVIVQMGHRDFETECADGFEVIGRRCHTESSRGEPGLAWWLTQRFARRNDAVLYAAGERGWPFFRAGSKGIQHGVWWDGPLPLHKRLVQRERMLRFMRSMRSVLCVDTNFVNWLRVRGPAGLELASRCRYLPNYADTDRIAPGDPDRAPGRPLRLLYARRFQACRGPFLFLDALARLKQRGFPFHATMFTVGGEPELRRGVRERGIEQDVTLGRADMNGILAQYANADVAVVPTIWSEGTSFSAVEALCAGVPVVTTPVGGLGNLVIPGFNGEVAAPTPEGLAEAIERMGDEARWRRMRTSCLSMRSSLGMPRWRDQALEWIKA